MPTYDKVSLDKVNFGFVLNDILPTQTTPIDLGGWTLDKATEEEIEIFRPIILQYCAVSFIRYPLQESSVVFRDTGSTRTWHRDLPESWRYTVVRPNHKDAMLGSKLAEALRLCESDLWVELWCIKSIDYLTKEQVAKFGGRSGRAIRFFQRFFHDYRPVEINVGNLREFVELRNSLDEELFPNIATAINRFFELDSNDETELKILGYFGVLERLLSHAPQPNDSADSITRQLKRNLKLLNNRMPEEFKIGIDDFVDVG